MLGVADREAAPSGGIDAAAGSRTIESEGDASHTRACLMAVRSRFAPRRTARARRAGAPSAEPGAGSAGRGAAGAALMIITANFGKAYARSRDDGC